MKLLSKKLYLIALKILKSEPINKEIKKIRIKIREKESNGQDSIKELTALAELRKELNDL